MEDYNETYDDMMNSSESYQPYYERPETYIVPLIFALIFVIGVVGNGTLVAVFVRHKAMRNVPNTYILSLALADLLVIITCVPFTSIVYTVESWPWGATVCRVSEAAKDVSIGVSVFTLTALSADRYFAIVDPLRKLHATVPSMLPIPSGVGRRLPKRHRADEIPGLLLLAAGRHSTVLHPDGTTSGPQHAKCSWRDAGDSETDASEKKGRRDRASIRSSICRVLSAFSRFHDVVLLLPHSTRGLQWLVACPEDHRLLSVLPQQLRQPHSPVLHQRHLQETL